MSTPNPSSDSHGWFKAMRSAEALELIRRYPPAFVLAYIIASRARWKEGFNEHNLEPGEAFLGDFEKCGMSEQQYRTAKAHLTEWHFAAFKPTNSGTVGKLIDSRLFETCVSHSNAQANPQPTDAQRTPNGRPTTNEEWKKEKKEKQGETPPSLPDHPRDLERMLEMIDNELAKLSPEFTGAAKFRDSTGKLLPKYAEKKKDLRDRKRNVEAKLMGCAPIET